MAAEGSSRLTLKLSRWAAVAQAVSAGLLSGAALVAIDAGWHLGPRPRTLMGLAWLIFLMWHAWRATRPHRIPTLVSTLLQVFFASTLLLVALIVACFAPGSPERLRRWVTPWHTAAQDRPFRIFVPSGHGVLALGEAVTLVGYLEPGRYLTERPDAMTLHLRNLANQAETRHDMQRDDAGTFWFTCPNVRDDFEYQLESGTERSGWYRMVVDQPVQLLPTTTIQVMPPTYAEGLTPTRRLTSWQDLDVLAYSKVELTLRFNRPITETRLELHSADGRITLIPVRLDTDRTAGIVRFEANQSGTLNLQLIGEKSLRTEATARLRTISDQPPFFEKVIGISPSELEARPGDRLLLELSARDDLQIARAWVEYTTNPKGESILKEPLRIAGLGTSRLDGTAMLTLQNKCREGKTLLYRVVVADNRQVLSAYLSAQEVRFPAQGWSRLRITHQAIPLAEQEIQGDRQRIQTVLNQTQNDWRNLLERLNALQKQPFADGGLPVNLAVSVRDAAEIVENLRQTVDALSQGLQLTPELASLAKELGKVANDEITAIAQVLKRVEAAPRGADKLVASQQAHQATNKLLTERWPSLAKRTDELAAVRSAWRGLRELANDQRELADLATQPEANREEITRQQRELNARLNGLINKHGLLNQAVQQATQEEIRQTLNRAKSWLTADQELDSARQATERQFRTARLHTLEQMQRSLTALAEQLAERTQTAARVAGTSPSQLAPFRQSSQYLLATEALKALSEQEKASREAERMAQELRRGVQLRLDRREALRQLARWQDDLRRRFSDTRSQLNAPEFQEFLAEQKLLQQTLDSIWAGEPDASSTTAVQAVQKELRTSLAELGRSSRTAETSMKAAADALIRLTEQTPTWTERLKAAKPKLEQLRKEFENLRSDLDRALLIREKDPTADSFTEFTPRLTQWKSRLTRLDLPGVEPRQAVLLAITEMALEDLRSGSLPDVPTSVLLVKKQLDKLRQALDGQPLAEELLEEAISKQQTLAQSIQLTAAASSVLLAEWEMQQRERSRALARIPDQDAPFAFLDLKLISENLEIAFRQTEPLAQLRERQQQLLHKMTTLHQRLIGGESDLARVERLILERRADAKLGQGAGPSQMKLAQEMARRADQQLEDLQQTRVGNAASAKKLTIAALQKLRQAPQADRRPALHQEALETLEKLASELRPQAALVSPWAERVPAVQSERPRLQQLTGGGRLPSEAAAELSSELARQQQLARDATANALQQLQAGIARQPQDTLQRLVQECEAESLFRSSPARADLLKALRLGAAAAARPLLNRLQLDPTASAEQLARQRQWIQAVATALDQVEVQHTRQDRRQQELMQEALELMLECRRLATNRSGLFNEHLLRVATTLEEIREAQSKAMQERQAQRWHLAEPFRDSARRLRSTLMNDVEQQLKGPATANDPNAVWLSGMAILTSLDAMQEVVQRLAQPQGNRLASEAMSTAVEALNRAASRIRPLMIIP